MVARTHQHHVLVPIGVYFVLPVTIVFLGVRVLPSFGALYLSFTDYSGLQAPHWVGLANYRALVSDPVFRDALVNTIVYSIGVVVPSVLIGLGIALLLNSRIFFRGFFRTLFYLPAVVSFVSIATIWAYLLNSQFGVVNYALTLVGSPKVAWLDSTTTALPTLIAIGIWKNVGYTTVIYLAGLQAIPEELYEAARIDGTNAAQRFLEITWPLLRPVTVFAMLITGIAAFQAFDQVLVLTAGGPARASTTVVLETYRNAFEFLRFGYAAAMAFLLFVIIAGFGSALIRLRDPEARRQPCEA
jgi:ABC-type sugar transport system permease subunit